MEIPLNIHINNSEEESVDIILKLDEKIDSENIHFWIAEKNDSDVEITISYLLENNSADKREIKKKYQYFSENLDFL